MSLDKEQSMFIPLQITYRGMSSSPSVDELIAERANKLERFSERILRCHVIIDVPHRHQRQGRHFSVHLDVTTPLGSIVVTRDPASDSEPRELASLVREAFDAAARQLEEETRRRRAS
jgi:ribosome-associated translation inhibitor RaiA